jgi:hypothetical protein
MRRAFTAFEGSVCGHLGFGYYGGDGDITVSGCGHYFRFNKDPLSSVFFSQAIGQVLEPGGSIVPSQCFFYPI